jgi:predicted deacylase
MELQTKTIVGRADKPHLLIVGGVHGDEWEPMSACRRLIGEFHSTMLRGRVTIVPVVNEAAFARGTRMADDGLDLARVCPGRDDGSITEQTAAALARLIRKADYFIDMHTAGTVFQLLPLAGYGIHADPGVLGAQRLMARAFNLPLVWGTDGRFNGTSLSVARDAKVPAIYVEHGGGGSCDPRRVDECVAGCLQVARALGMIDAPEPVSRVRYFVEDDRDRSGHLQGKCTSPAAGYFQPEVGLGDIVKEGQPIGRIDDPLGERSVPITAYTSGTVLLLRSFPSVKVGDPLIVILPVTAPGEYAFAHE